MRTGWFAALAAMLYLAANVSAQQADDKATPALPAVTEDNIFVLAAPQEPNDTSRHLAHGFPSQPPLLLREFARQMLLMGARDDMGLYTRDEELGETVPENLGNLIDRRAVLSTLYGDNFNLDVKLTVGAAPMKQTSAPIFFSTNWVPDLLKFLKVSEESTSMFANWLKAAGIDKMPVQPVSTAEIPPEALPLLKELSIYSQYRAVQMLHGAIRQQGASPQLLGGLVCGYANLSELTRFQWTASSDVFAARALLYAQRMIRTGHNSPTALWHRAYALALVGDHALALKDIEDAKAADGVTGAADDPDAPPWGSLIEALCHYQTSRLVELAQKQPDDAPLAQFFAFLTVQNCNSQFKTIQIGMVAMQANPQCDQIVDAMTELAGVSYLHGLTETALQMPIDGLRSQLPNTPNLPNRVHTVLTKAHSNPDLMQDVADVSHAFVDSPDAAEPSWSMLGRLMQESNFVHAYRRAYFYAFDFSDDPADEIKRLMPLAYGHRYAPLMTAIDANFHHRQVPAELAGLPFPDPTFRFTSNMAFYWMLSGVRDDYANFFALQMNHLDHTAWDLERYLQVDKTNDNRSALSVPFANMLQEISPDSPSAPADIIEWDWPTAQKHLSDWAVTYKGHPAFYGALATHYQTEKQYPQAIEAWKNYIASAPDVDAYQHLADGYLAIKNEDQWLATLEDSLKQEDMGLSHADTEMRIANHYMARHDYKKALPFADASNNDSGAEWAIDCDSRCHLGLGDFATAVQLGNDSYQRYSEPFQWYFCCRSTGKGDLKAAQSAMKAWIAATPISTSAVAFFMAEKDPTSAIAGLKEYLKAKPSTYMTLWLACVEDSEGHHDECNAALRKAIASDRANSNKTSTAPSDKALPVIDGDLANAAQFIQDALANHNGQVDSAAFDKQFGSLPKSRRAQVEYFIAEIQMQNGQSVEGLVRLKDAAKTLPLDYTACQLACMELFDHGVNPYGLDAPAK